ncbi:tRNA synthetases class I (W and y) domain-containing protein [Hirsutella rhossiliensis]|uniref:Tyrosine--tRNA ligase n=1 Tax=Hirsutella rhossiliensis TaxID=111463 RepID=A0A9P8MXY6_9HYPO|nr:tRNA synthetases class I (W and y) domain-containing protein [Hirsutella rhossiliensis]KAH0962336.1 tRNA synthetases class I (W and y) domain-containing protein [Hirsutella rhossiliensis]
MASRALPRGLVRTRPGTSPRCALTSSLWSLPALHRGRGIATTYLKKVADGEERWAERAAKIEKGELPHVWDILDERGYMKDIAGTPKNIKETMRVKRIGAYVGVDPTADSLHLGHLLPMMALFWLWFHGHPAVTLIGGATARIGDPTGRMTSRAIVSNGIIAKNITKMHYQISKIWVNVIELKRKYGYPDDWAAKRHLLNNSMWLQGLSMYDFTKAIARHTRVGPMLSRDTVKQRLEGGEGISVGELLYPLFQGWDFWHMYKKLGIQMQIGGSDQFGNIVSGIDAVKIIREHEETGFTVPLLTDSSGAKLGKSDGNALWLDEFKTSAFDLYGYFVRRSDDEVERLLKLFTFLPMDKIQEIMVEHREDPTKRLAQHNLAFEVLSLVHGSQRALEEAQQHEFRFGGNLPKIVKVPTPESGIVVPNNAPRSDIELPRSVLKLSPARILFACGLASSASDGQRLVSQQGAYVAAQPGQKRGLVPGSLNWTPIKMWFPDETLRYVLDERLLILRKGKHNVRIVELVSDEAWADSKRVYPGEPFKGLVRRTKEAMREQAEARGEAPMRAKDFRVQLLEQKKLWVANNPDIELPTKRELREQAHWKKRGSSRSRSIRLGSPKAVSTRTGPPRKGSPKRGYSRSGRMTSFGRSISGGSNSGSSDSGGSNSAW